MIKEVALAGLMTVMTPVTLPVVKSPQQTFIDYRSVQCLAMNMYHEARNQGSA